MCSVPSELHPPQGPRWTRTLGFRLNAWYAFVITTGLAATYLVVALLTSYAVDRADRQIIVAKLEEYRARFEEPALRDLTFELPPSAISVEDEPYLVRVCDADNRALFTHVPASGLVFDESSLVVVTSEDRHMWTRVRSVGDGRTWTIGSALLSNGRNLQIGMSSEHSDRIVNRLRETFVLGFVPLLVLGLVGGAYLTRRALRPIQDLSRTMRAIETSGDLTARVPDRGAADELEDLSKVFNRLISKQERLVTAMRESLDNVAHDLRTPLTRLRGAAEAALSRPPQPEPEQEQHDLREALADCLEESDRVGAMLKTLVDISEAQSGLARLDEASFEFDALAREVLGLYEYVAEARGVKVTHQLEPGVVVFGDKVRLFRAAANLLDNALKYTPAGRAVQVLVRSEDGQAVLEVIDEGIGIEAEDLGRIWERLYRADKSRTEAGLGLGLSFVRAIVEAHGGSVQVNSEPGQGSSFVMRVPQKRETPPADA